MKSPTCALSVERNGSNVIGDPKVTLRRANPSIEDGFVYAKFLNQAADGFFEFMLGKKFAETIADTFATPAHDFSFENVLFAEQDTIVVGMASGFSARQHHHCSDKVLTTARGFPWFRMSMIHMIFGSLLRFLDTLEDSSYYLQAIAVDRELRGKGIGSMLIDAMETRGIDSGARRFALDVAGKNEGALRLYESRGMSSGARWPSRFPLPAFRIVRMTKSLSEDSKLMEVEPTMAQ